MDSSPTYGHRSLEQKLGLKDGMNIRLINPPDNYFDLLQNIPSDLKINPGTDTPKNFIHLFSSSPDEVSSLLPHLKKEILNNGCIWVSWPKKSSGVKSTLDGNVIRKWAIYCGLVDSKVCSVDETWSALKLVIPIKNRK